MPSPEKANSTVSARGPLLVFVCLLTLVSFGMFWIDSSPQRSSQQGINDVKQAVGKGDTRFVSVLVGTVAIPGIPDGQFNSLVLLHKYKNPIGVGDFILTPVQGRQQNAAVEYALNYNSLLLKHILNNPDAKTRRYLGKFDQELKKFQNADPQRDALQAFEQNKGFLMVTGSRDLGYPVEDNRASWVGTQLLLINSSILRGKERKKFEEVIRSYIIPHNKALYKLLQQKWERQGIKKGMKPY